MKLRGKKALITGGNRGIGLATARLFVVEASDDSSYINAIELMVDGGATGAPWGVPIFHE